MGTLLGIMCVTSLISAAGAVRVLIAISDFESQVSYTERLAKDLYLQGHEITVLIGSNLMKSFSTLKSDDKINYLKFDCQDPVFAEKDTFKSVAHMLMQQSSMLSRWTSYNIEVELFQEYGYCLFEDQQVIKDLRSRNFNFVLVSATTAPFVFIPYMLQVPYAIITLDCFNNFRRIPVLPGYVPHVFTPFSDNMTFLERFVNFLVTAFMAVRDPGGYDVSRKYVPELPVVGYKELFRNASLCLQLRDNILDFISPVMPDTIPISSLIIKPSQDLQPDLASFVNNASNGFIIVSLGTIVPDPPEAISGIIMDALQTSTYSVLIKKKLCPANTSAHVLVLPWLPQNDLLGHPKAKLLVSHCGKNSIVEAVYHGVPMICLPLIYDQHHNAAFVKAKGIGRMVHFHELDDKNFKEAIFDVIVNDRYRLAITKLSAIFKDIEEHGLYDPIPWINHVIRYGGKHLRTSAYDIPDYQYFMIDTIGTILICILAVTTICLYVCKYLVDVLCVRKIKNKTE